MSPFVQVFEEETPADIRHSVIIDDATLAKVGGQETCFTAKLRTGSRYDEPVQQLDPRCRVDGETTVDAVAQNETLSSSAPPTSAARPTRPAKSS
jgi:hypothetical protein